jgi:hypothetical protein
MVMFLGGEMWSAGKWQHVKETTEIREGKLFSPGNLRATFDNPEYEKLINYYVSEKYTLRYTGGMVPDVNQVRRDSRSRTSSVTLHRFCDIRTTMIPEHKSIHNRPFHSLCHFCVLIVDSREGEGYLHKCDLANH